MDTCIKAFVLIQDKLIGDVVFTQNFSADMSYSLAWESSLSSYAVAALSLVPWESYLQTSLVHTVWSQDLLLRRLARENRCHSLGPVRRKRKMALDVTRRG